LFEQRLYLQSATHTQLTVILLLQSLYPYFVRYRWTLFQGFVCLLITNLFAIYPAQVVRQAFDTVKVLIEQFSAAGSEQVRVSVGNEIAWQLAQFGLLVVGASILRGLFLFWVRQTIIVLSRKIEYDQKNQLFDVFQTYTQTTRRNLQTGDLMARIGEDVANVRMFTGPGIMYSINTITLSVMVLITMLAVNPELSLYVLAPLPVLALSIYVVHQQIIKRSEEAQAQLSKLSSLVQESFSGIRLVKSFSREDVFNRRFEAESDEYSRRAMRQVQVDALFWPLIMVLIGLSTLFTVWIGGLKVMAGEITIGNIAEFMLYVNMMIWPVTAMGWVTSLMQKAAASQKRINAMLALKPELQFPAEDLSPEPETPGTPLVRFDHVSYTYPDTGITAVRDLSFRLEPGQVLGIVGTTGSGKTTVAQLMQRLMEASDGQIELRGKPIQAYPEKQLRQLFGYVPQDSFLFSDTLSANIGFGKTDATPDEIEAAARFAGVYDDILGFPDGFATVVGERGVTLSGGQKQRIAIARAYLTRAPILILDDSLSAVDTRTEETILHNLRTPTADYRPTLVLITHRLSVVQNADQILVLENGVAVQHGTYAELLAQPGLFVGLHRRQQLEAEVLA
jgi:ATP-binding cassette subfamily B protein